MGQYYIEFRGEFPAFWEKYRENTSVLIVAGAELNEDGGSTSVLFQSVIRKISSSENLNTESGNSSNPSGDQRVDFKGEHCGHEDRVGNTSIHLKYT